MKKVRLFAVAAAMGMFASTVAAAEPVVSTGYTTTWEGVEEIIKVDVGNKVVAPVTTIKVVKETRTTDTEYEVTEDTLGFETGANCWTSTGVAEDENDDNYSDVQIYTNGLTGGYYLSKEEAIKDYLYDNNLILAPGAEEVEEGAYYAKYANKTFADYEEAFAWLVEEGLYELVYDEDGELTNILVKPTVITDKKGNKLADARLNVSTTPRTEDDVKEALVNLAVEGVGLDSLDFVREALYTYSEDDAEEGTYEFWAKINDVDTLVEEGGILIVDEYKGELEAVAYYADQEEAEDAGLYFTGWTFEEDPIAPKGTDGKVTVYEVASKKGEVVKIATIKPTKVKAYTSTAKMIWDEEVGSFVKTTDDFVTVARGTTIANGFWYSNEYDEEDNKTGSDFTTSELGVGENTLGLTVKNTSYANESGKWLLVADYNAVNTKKEQVTLAYGTDKEVIVNAVEVAKNVWLPAFSSEAELIKVVSKLSDFAGLANKFDPEDVDYEADFETWYNATEELVDNYWSGYTHEGDLPENELQGAGSEACSYVVSVENETVDATVEASEVDTTEAGVKTMTLSAKVDGEVVATKDVKVVVAPRYERTYVNGKVAVLKSFYLDGTLYSEYHYDWAAKTYTATFYANDGVTVASTANGTL